MYAKNYRPTYYQTHQKEIIAYRKAYRKEHYQKIKELRQDYSKKNQLRYAEFIATKWCVVCGENDFRCLELHHRIPLHGRNGRMSAKGITPWPRLLRELKKCDILCANCHLIIHYENLVRERKNHD